MCVCVCVCVCVPAGAVRAALNDHNVERARAPKHRERRRAPPPRALAWVGSTRCGAQQLYHASHPQWPSRPPLELAPSGSQIERGRLSRTVAGRTRTEPSPFAAAAGRQPSAVQPYSRQPSARSRRRCRRRSSSERAPASCCRRSVDARRPAASERARSWVGALGRTAPVNRQPARPLVQNVFRLVPGMYRHKNSLFSFSDSDSTPLSSLSRKAPPNSLN